MGGQQKARARRRMQPTIIYRVHVWVRAAPPVCLQTRPERVDAMSGQSPAAPAATAALAATTAAASSANAVPAAALLSFAASPAAPTLVSADYASSSDPSASASSSASESSVARPSGTVRVWQVEVIEMWIGMRIENITMQTSLFLTLESALDFAYAQACRFEEMAQESRYTTDADTAQQALERAENGNYHWNEPSDPGWGNKIKTTESTINFNSAPGAAIFSSAYSSYDC